MGALVSFQRAYQTLVEVTKSGSRIERRDAIQKFEDALLTLPQVDQPLKHHFVNKMYWREIFNPKGCIITTKIHGEPNISVILQGCITEDSVSILQAPMMFELADAISQPPGGPPAPVAFEVAQRLALRHWSDHGGILGPWHVEAGALRKLRDGLSAVPEFSVSCDNQRGISISKEPIGDCVHAPHPHR